MSQNINGPINLARIEKDGNIIHFFMDYHENIVDQTVCEDIRSTDISKFFMNIFDNAKTPVQFYIESIPMHHKDGASKTEGRYADRVINLLLKTFNDGTKEHDIYKSKTFNNVTLHFVDIRSYIFSNIDNLFMELLNIKQIIWLKKDINTAIIERLEIILSKINNDIKQLRNKIKGSILGSKVLEEKMLLNKINNSDSPDIKVVKDKFLRKSRRDYIIDKIRNGYKNTYVQTEINNYIDTDMEQVFKSLFKQYDNISKYIKVVKKDISGNPKNTLYYIEEELSYGIPRSKINGYIYELDALIDTYYNTWFVNIPSKYMDLYVLRKILESDHKNIISYTGIEHSISMIYFLVKHFGYSITNMSTILDNSNLETLNSKLKTDKYSSIRHHFFPKQLTQCIDVSGFPPIN